MASATVKRDISTIFLLVLSITGAIFGLPLAEVDGENRDGQIAQPNGQQMFPADMPPPPPGAFNDPGPGVLPPSKLPEPPADDVAPLSNNGLVVNPPAEAAGVAGTGLAMMAGPMVPGADTGGMFPVNMAPPPEGAVNDMVPAEEQVVPAKNGGMFPDNMPPPPPGAFNDGAARPIELEIAPLENEVNQDNIVPPNKDIASPPYRGMFPPNMPPPPPGAMNDAVLDFEKKELPVNNGDMFPVNMPPPPKGAVNDVVLDIEKKVVPVNNGGMFPVNMPPPPKGAVNDDVLDIEKKVEPVYNGGMFPPNMPPPPPGAFNEPPPIPKQKAYPAMPSDGTAVKPTYVNGMNVPDAAVVPPSDPNLYMDPNQKPSLPSNQQYVGTENGPSNAPQYQPDIAVSNNPNTPYSQADGNPQAISPNTPDNPGEDQAEYNPEDPDNLDVSKNPSPIINDQPVESVQNQNEGQIPYNPDELDNPTPISANNEPVEFFPNQNEEDVAPVNPSAPEADNGDEIPSQSPSESTSEQSYEGFDESSSYEGAQNKVQGDSQQWSPEESDSVSEEVEESAWEESQSESDYSFMNWMESSDYDSADSNNEGDDSTDSYNEGDGATENSLEDSESDQYGSSYLEEDGSDYSDSSELDWIFNGGSSMAAGSETSEEEEEEEEDYFGQDLAHETGSHGEDQKQTFPTEFMGEDDMYRTGGTKLIMYCIPALILCVLILLAWKNYRGRIRVVSVHSVDNKQYDWKSDRKSEEHAPMLLDQDQEDRGY